MQEQFDSAITAVEEMGSARGLWGVKWPDLLPYQTHKQSTTRGPRTGEDEPMHLRLLVKAAVVAALDRLASGQLHRAEDRIAFIGKDRSFSMSSMNIESQPDCAKVPGIVCSFASE